MLLCLDIACIIDYNFFKPHRKGFHNVIFQKQISEPRRAIRLPLYSRICNRGLFGNRGTPRSHFSGCGTNCTAKFLRSIIHTRQYGCRRTRYLGFSNRRVTTRDLSDEPGQILRRINNSSVFRHHAQRNCRLRDLLDRAMRRSFGASQRR